MKEPVNVICAANAGYIMPLCVMLVSLVDNFEPDRKLILHIISNEATDQHRRDVSESIRLTRPGMENIEIHWHSVDLSWLEGLPVPEGYLTSDAFARIFAPGILPESCRRAIYLDCDLVVLVDLSLLYDSTAAAGTLLHAAHDVANPWVSSHLGVFDYVERGLPSKTRCFNSGVMVVDLQQWRERNLTPPLRNYLIKNGNRVALGDQGALNALLHADWTSLDHRWNQSSSVLFPAWWEAAGYSPEEWLRTRNDPYIVHYAGTKKPWQPGRRAPRYSYFYKYLAKTVYKGSIRNPPFLENIIGVILYYHLWRWARRLGKMKKANS